MILLMLMFYRRGIDLSILLAYDLYFRMDEESIASPDPQNRTRNNLTLLVIAWLFAFKVVARLLACLF